MHLSIVKIFRGIKSLLALALLLVILLTAAIVSEYSSFYKLENLQKQKALATSVYNLSRDDMDLANIQYRGNNTMLKHEGEALSLFFAYDYINKFSKEHNYRNELSKLQFAINDFNTAAGEWYTQEEVGDEELQKRHEHFSKAYHVLMAQINDLTSRNLGYEQRRFQIEITLVILIVLVALFSAFWVSRRLNIVQRDILSLYATENDDLSRFATSEAETIAKHMGRTAKTPTVQNPAYLDSVTGLNNQKGFMHEYTDKKSQKPGNYTAICIFSIDKLSELERQYPGDFADNIIKKVSFMLSLYRQHNDVIGRLDHNQFAIILSRSDKSNAIGDCELIRKSIAETPFKTTDGQSVAVTVSGGFVQKMVTQKLEEVIAKANKVVSMSVQHGGNRIAQLRDKSTALK